MLENTGVKGYLVVTVEEASGKTKNDTCVWDSMPNLEAFVKVEVRGPTVKTTKAHTRKAVLQGDVFTWHEQIILEVLENANELRLMLCREKFQANKRASSVVAACGIYMTDIIDAVPIDKYFELFKPNNQGDGGFLRISMNFVKDKNALKPKGPAIGNGSTPSTLSSAPNRAGSGVALTELPAAQASASADIAKSVQNMDQLAAADENQTKRKSSGKGLPVKLGIVTVVAFGAVFLAKALRR